MASNVKLEATKKTKDDSHVKNVAHWVETIAQKVPVVQDLEKRLDIMQGLDPLMDGILKEMHDCTDNSRLELLQKKAVKKEQRHKQLALAENETDNQADN